MALFHIRINELGDGADGVAALSHPALVIFGAGRAFDDTDKGLIMLAAWRGISSLTATSLLRVVKS